MTGRDGGLRPARWSGLRSRLAATDPGHTRLHLASVATAAMITAALLASGLRALTGQPVTTVLFSVVLAMVSNLAVNEPTLARRRVTTALMLVPATASASLSALLSGQRFAADIVFVLVMMVAVAVRRYGPRGVALGMAAFMPFFFVQFLHAGIADLPYLLAGAAIGIGSTFVLRCLVFTRRTEAVLDALVRAFEARLHAVLLAASDVLEDRDGPRRSADLDDLVRAQSRLNTTALAVADRLDEADDDPAARRPAYLPGGARPGGPDDAETEIAGLRQWVVDSELAAERVAMGIRRSVEHGDTIPGPEREALAEGVRALAAATAVGTPQPIARRLYQDARDAVGPIVERPGGSGPDAREQRIGFAVLRLADAVQSTIEQARRGIARRRDEPGTIRPEDAPSVPDDGPGGLALHTRQAVQVGVATACAVVVGELISPARWYWAVIAAFIVFAGTASRGDVLSRGWSRAVGTTGGVVAGMLLALLVGGDVVASLVLLFVCVFLALYLVQISQTMMAFWLTAVLALLYGLIGQFSVETMLLRVEETVAGGALGMLAAYLILPTRSRTAFAEALSDALRAVDASLHTSVDRALGRPAEDPLLKAREVDEAVATVRDRARPLEHPVARRPLRRGVHHTVRVIGALDHYTRLLAAQAAVAHVPEWAPTLDPATERVRANVDGLRRILADGWGPAARREHPAGACPADYGVVSAEDLVDAAEAEASAATSAAGITGPTDTAGWIAPADPRIRDAAAGAPPGDRLRRLAAARLLRRVDQLAVGLARELCGDPPERTSRSGTAGSADQSPRTATGGPSDDVRT
ncbi:FUSC family protein [Pseudonocardia sp. HH130630-07]|uniref:FUSC family protein n=1 Tax=Pseudonocardia sp. HH130630-07 TaxID=1690815 RepID=UPI000814DA4E|nr:FUSC family protein [Pseudonocardia sp. HH130630-07]ANY09104.1 hypothetical protein AFB00_25790 [Pseudonocardia sp. HH130630-07]